MRRFFCAPGKAPFLFFAPGRKGARLPSAASPPVPFPCLPRARFKLDVPEPRDCPFSLSAARPGAKKGEAEGPSPLFRFFSRAYSSSSSDEVLPLLPLTALLSSEV